MSNRKRGTTRKQKLVKKGEAAAVMAAMAWTAMACFVVLRQINGYQRIRRA